MLTPAELAAHLRVSERTMLLDAEELRALTSYTQQSKQLATLHRMGFWRARVGQQHPSGAATALTGMAARPLPTAVLQLQPGQGPEWRRMSSRERPILMSAPMVRAILAGTKTQTRRVVKAAHPEWVRVDPTPHPDGDGRLCYGWDGNIGKPMRCPYGQPGDRLWVREAWQAVSGTDRARRIVMNPRPSFGWVEYAASPMDEAPPRWRPSIHMPRWASRITLEVTDVRVERLQDISEADAQAEGIAYSERFKGYCIDMAEHFNSHDPRQSYLSLWESINGTGSVEANQWVWVVEFKVC